jgi:hypothetical protein
MVEQEVIRINHPGKLRKGVCAKYIITMVAIEILAYFWIIINYLPKDEFGRINYFPESNMVFMTLLFISTQGFFMLYFDFTTFEYTSEEMIMISPARGPNKQIREYHLPYSSIRKISLNFMSTYFIQLREDPRNPIPSQWKRNVMLNIVIPLRLMRSQENERRIFEAMEQLNRYYQRIPGAVITYHRPTVFYSPRWDVKKLRKREGNIIFEVELPKPVKRPLTVDERVR